MNRLKKNLLRYRDLQDKSFTEDFFFQVDRVLREINTEIKELYKRNPEISNILLRDLENIIYSEFGESLNNFDSLFDKVYLPVELKVEIIMYILTENDEMFPDPSFELINLLRYVTSKGTLDFVYPLLKIIRIYANPISLEALQVVLQIQDSDLYFSEIYGEIELIVAYLLEVNPDGIEFLLKKNIHHDVPKIKMICEKYLSRL